MTKKQMAILRSIGGNLKLTFRDGFFLLEGEQIASQGAARNLVRAGLIYEHPLSGLWCLSASGHTALAVAKEGT